MNKEIPFKKLSRAAQLKRWLKEVLMVKKECKETDFWTPVAFQCSCLQSTAQFLIEGTELSVLQEAVWWF